MKFTKFGALALASLVAFSSCSKEEAMNSGAEDLMPGEARIVLDLGKKGPTTYSTIANETAIKNGAAKLFKTTGEAVPMTNATIDPTTGKLTATVAADNVTGAGEVILFAYLNATTINEGTETTKTAMQKHENAIVESTLDRGLTAGAPAGFKSAPFTLKSGNNAVTAGSAKRAIARLGVKNATKDLADADKLSIADFQIKLTGVILSGGDLYGGLTNAISDLDGTETVDYPVVGDGKLNDINLTGGVETVAYMYPSKLVTAVVTSPEGVAKTVTFQPKANMNYTLNITPSKTEGAEIDFTVSIDKAWANGTDMDVDFSGTKAGSVAVETLNIPEFMRATAEGNVITMSEFAAASKETLNLATVSVVVDPTDGTVEDFTVTKIEVDKPSHKTLLFAVQGTKLLVSSVPNDSKVDAISVVTLTGTVAGVEKTSSFKIEQKAMSADFIEAWAYCQVEMGGETYMQFGSSATFIGDYDLAKKIFDAKALDNEEAAKNNLTLFKSHDASPNAGCPKGYIRPTLDNIITLVGDRGGLGDKFETPWVATVDATRTNGTFTLKNIMQDGNTTLANKSLYSISSTDGKVLYLPGTKLIMTSTNVRDRYTKGDQPPVSAKDPMGAFSVAWHGAYFTFVNKVADAKKAHMELRCIKQKDFVLN